ncbi:hypothetical protein QT23_00145, partial [Staphylococcus aureus]
FRDAPVAVEGRARAAHAHQPAGAQDRAVFLDVELAFGLGDCRGGSVDASLREAHRPDLVEPVRPGRQFHAEQRRDRERALERERGQERRLERHYRQCGSRLERPGDEARYLEGGAAVLREGELVDIVERAVAHGERGRGNADAP